MFDRIARVYDRMNSVMTAGMHHRWRRRAAELAQVGPGLAALDVATGTGDLAIELARRGAEVTGLGLRSARCSRSRGERRPGCASRRATRSTLAYPDGSFDAVTVGFGARNFADLDRGLAEMARVTRPGGRVVVLEITTPQKPPLSLVLPRSGSTGSCPRWAGSPATRTPTRTCPSSVRRFPGPEELGGRMAAAGLDDVRWILTAGGIIAIHVGNEAHEQHGTGAARARCSPRAARSWPACSSAPRTRLARGGRGPRRRARPPRRRHARRGRQAAAPGARVPVRRTATPTSGWWRPAWRWSCSTWPRSCTTTCSTRADLRRGRPTVFADGGRAAATATGDLLFSRAFAELAATGSEDAVRALSAASSRARPRRADAARRRLERRRDARSATSSAAG